jgi:hypothetical protein
MKLLLIIARYKSAEEKLPLNEAMKQIFPVIHHIGSQLVADQSEPSAQIQKQILKVFYAHIQVIFIKPETTFISCVEYDISKKQLQASASFSFF